MSRHWAVPVEFPKWIPDPTDPTGQRGDAVNTAAEEVMLLELRRLRSDDWLEEAAEECVSCVTNDGEIDYEPDGGLRLSGSAAFLAVMRKCKAARP